MSVQRRATLVEEAVVLLIKNLRSRTSDGVYVIELLSHEDARLRKIAAELGKGPGQPPKRSAPRG